MAVTIVRTDIGITVMRGGPRCVYPLPEIYKVRDSNHIHFIPRKGDQFWLELNYGLCSSGHLVDRGRISDMLLIEEPKIHVDTMLKRYEEEFFGDIIERYHRATKDCYVARAVAKTLYLRSFLIEKGVAKREVENLKRRGRMPF